MTFTIIDMKTDYRELKAIMLAGTIILAPMILFIIYLIVSRW